jgi:hypothetical protein
MVLRWQHLKKNTFLKKNNTFVRLGEKGHKVEGQHLLVF